MSTKNLSRTVIEGGRDGYSRFSRRHSHVVERRRAHMVEHELCTSLAYEDVEFPALKQAYKSFTDKLSPARRWLRSQVGRPWDKVRSDLFARFDTRTTAGRHIVFDHLLKEVDVEPVSHFRFREFWISSHGILRWQQFARKRQSAARRWPGLPETESVLRRWLGERRVIEHGERLYWLVVTLHGGFRQHQELNEADAKRFRSLPGWFREQFAGAPRVSGGSR